MWQLPGRGRVIRWSGYRCRIERKFDLPEPLYSVSFGPIHTPTVLGSPSQMEQVSSAFPLQLRMMHEDFFTKSKQFAERSGLMTGFGKKSFCICDAGGCSGGHDHARRWRLCLWKKSTGSTFPFGEVYEFQVSPTGPRIVEDLYDS